MLAIIDGDVLCYLACANRWEKTKSKVGAVHAIRLDNDGKRIPVEYTPEEDTRWLEMSMDKLRKLIQEVMDAVWATEALIAVKGPDNFRNEMYPNYKLNRHADPEKQNIFVPTLRKLLVHEELAIESNGREADDMLRIWAEQAVEAGDDYVICSIDKDLLCIPGKHYSIKKKEHIVMTPIAAMRHFYEQLLKGDQTDNIPGVPGIGPVKASKFLADLETEEEMQEVIVSQYIEAYGDDWRNYLLSNGKMLYLQKSPEDYFMISNWPIVKELS